MEGVVAQLETVSPAVTALIKQETLLNLYRSHLVDWNAAIQTEYRVAWKALIFRLCILAAAIAVLFGLSFALRRAVSIHVADTETRQAVLLGERVLCWGVILAVVLFAFAFDASSVATFLGLASAGLALGSRDVLLAIGGRALLARRLQNGRGAADRDRGCQR